MKKHYRRPYLAVAAFISAQCVVALMLVLLSKIAPQSMALFSSYQSPLALLITIALPSLLSVAFAALLKLIDWRTFAEPLPPMPRLIIYIAASAFGLLAFNIVEECFQLPDFLADDMLALAATTTGVIIVGIIGPVCEELVFREALLGGLLRAGAKPWAAIVASALCFGIIHLNPAQVPFAFAAGLMLGYIYHKTGSIIVPSIIHVINNSASLAQANILGGDPEPFSLTEHLGGPLPSIAIATACAIACIALLTDD